MAFVLDVGPSIRPFLSSMLQYANKVPAMGNVTKTNALNRTEIESIMTNGITYGYVKLCRVLGQLGLH